MSQIDRRSFLETTGAVAAAGMVTRSASGDANEKIRVAVLGVNGRGMAHVDALHGIKDAQLAVICDPDRNVLAQRAEKISSKYGTPVETETDLRRVFDRDDIDVVTVATPNHWHSLATIWACQAGKDVYVEKPGSHNLFEGRKMVEAANRHKRIVQHGVQLRSSPAIREAVQHLRDGLIGDVYMARALIFRWRPSIGHKPDLPNPPANLDWDLWQGPAKERAFSERLVHYNWHWHWDYGNGDVGNQGVHETDMALWGLDVGLPSEITAMGGKFLWEDDKETPEVLTTLFKYPDQNKMVQVETRHWCTNLEDGVGVGNIFYGSKGYLLIKGYEEYEVHFVNNRKRTPGPKGKAGNPVPAHFENFLSAVRSRKPETLHGPVETAHTSAGLAHLGNIAYRLDRRLEFDPKTERFVDDAEADRYLTREYRKGFEVPNEV